MKFNLDGSRNELRSDICMLQKDANAMRECHAELKTCMTDDGIAGFMVCVMIVVIWVIGFVMGKCG